MPTDAEQVLQHLLQMGTPLMPYQRHILLQELEALYAADHPHPLIASHAAALLRSFHAHTPLGVIALSPSAAPPSSAFHCRLIQQQFQQQQQLLLQQQQQLQLAQQALQRRQLQLALQAQVQQTTSLSAALSSSAQALLQQHNAALLPQALDFWRIQQQQRSPTPSFRLTDLPNEILGLIYSFLPSDSRRSFFMSCKEVHGCCSIQSRITQLSLPGLTAASDILSFPKGCTLKVMKLKISAAGCGVLACLQRLISLKASDERAEMLISSVEELKLLVPSEPEYEDDHPAIFLELFPIEATLPNLFPSLTKMQIEAHSWTAELQVILESVARGRAPGLHEVVFQFSSDSPGLQGFSPGDLMKVPNMQGLKILGIAPGPFFRDPHALQPIMQLTQLERLNLTNKHFWGWDGEENGPQLLALLPQLSYWHMLKFPWGFRIDMPRLSKLHIRWLKIQDLHELKQSLSRSCLPQLQAVIIEVLDLTLLASYSPEACAFSPDLMKGCPLDLSTTRLVAGSLQNVLDAEQLLLAISGIVSQGPPFSDIRSLRLNNCIFEETFVPPGIMASLASLLPKVTELFLAGYWSDGGKAYVKKAIECFKSLKELSVFTSQQYCDEAFQAFDRIYEELESSDMFPEGLCMYAGILEGVQGPSVDSVQEVVSNDENFGEEPSSGDESDL